MAAIMLAACAVAHPRAPAASLDDSDVTLYRDGALVQQRVELDVPAGGVATLRVRIPAGLGAADVVAFPREGVRVTLLREARAVETAAPPPGPPEPAAPEPEPELAEPSPAERGWISEPEPEPAAAPAPDPPVHDPPAELELVVRARPGRTALRLGYVTDRLTWEVAYTLTASPARDQAVLRGAIAIHNRTGIELPGAKVRLVDTSRADARSRAAGVLASPGSAEEPGDPPAPLRELGRVDLADGDTRVELVRDPAPRPMRSVLVYDPIGTRCDHDGVPPDTDPDLGVRPAPGRRVEESFEIERDPAATAGLPAGPVRLLERRAGGTLAVLGEARLFDATARAAASDTIAVGTADGVTGERERRELAVDHDRRRVVEELVITIDNARPRPVDVVVREHLYRGTTWALAYASVPVGPEAKEGPQQMAPRITVPPRSKGRFMYAVVYTW